MATALGLGRTTDLQQIAGKLADVANMTDLMAPKVTALNTVGAGTLLGAALVGGVIVRGGAQSSTPFTDTTDTAALIIAAMANPLTNASWEFTYQNATNAVATIAAGSGVTLTGNVVVPPGATAGFVVTMTSATAVSMVSLQGAAAASLPAAKFTTAAKSVGTFAAGDITGAAFVVLTNTGATPGTQTVRTAAQMLADIPGAASGFSSMFKIINTGAGTLTIGADAGPTVTLTGTMTVAQNVWRDYVLTFPTATTATIQSVGAGTSP
jgi:hypothetical protein